VVGDLKMIRVKIVPNDSRNVAKAIIVDSDKRVLFLKRSDYVDKFAGEWDLPGGHIQIGEDLMVGLKREVKEETSLDVKEFKFVDKLENIKFFVCDYTDQPIKISHEHTGFRFFKESDLDKNGKFEKMAIKALEMMND
jgi:8-oxo-dGTP pyrophosphatase MutT (NUDIX family)